MAEVVAPLRCIQLSTRSGIARFVLGLRKYLEDDTSSIELVDVNRETGLCVRADGRIVAVV